MFWHAASGSHSFVCLFFTDERGNVPPSPFLELQFGTKSQKEKSKAKIELPADLFLDVDPYLDLDYAAAMGAPPGGADSLVPVHVSDCPQSSPTLIQSLASSFDIESTVPHRNGYCFASPSLSHSVSFYPSFRFPFQ